MPLIEVTVPEGTLDAAARGSLIRDLTTAVMKVEGIPDSPQARKLTWVFVTEASRGDWGIGGDAATDLRFLVRVTVPLGTLSPARRRRMGLDISKVLAGVLGREPKPDDAWIILHEISDGHWTAGGKILTLEDVSTYVGMDALKKRTKVQGKIGFGSGLDRGAS